jgi:glycosyltransferase involved in cell wall biosynthesis
MKILFIHPNFPGQFKHLVKHFANDVNNEVVFACTYPNKQIVPRVRKVISRPKLPPPNNTTHQYLSSFERAIYSAQSMWRVCNKLKRSGFTPDVIYAHPGWGDGMLLKDIYPNTPYIAYMEFYYQAFGADVHFYPNEKIVPDKVAKTRIKNATNLINLSACDWAISPTHWQANLHPKDFHHKFSVIHEGIDTDLITLNNKAGKLELPTGSILPNDSEIVTYVARNFEPYRGFEQVMQVIELVMKKRPKAHFLMIGGDEVSYGAKLPNGKTYRQKMLEELSLDPARIHWYGKLPFNQYLNVLKHSMAHLYMTVPFVLSWSLLEAMSIRCPIVASNTAPVQEVITHQKNGLLADFFALDEMASQISTLLDNSHLRIQYGQAARDTILKQYSLNRILPMYTQLITDIIHGNIPTETTNILKP